MPPTLTVRWMDAGTLRSGGTGELDAAKASGGSTWVDVLAPDEAILRELAARFSLHPLAVEDVLHDGQRPKFESYPSGPFFVWVVPQRVEGDVLKTCELDVFLGHGVLITAHAEPVGAVTEVANDPSCVLERGPEWALHAILDRAVDEVFPITDAVGDELDDIGDTLLEHVDRSALPRLHALKRLLLELHKVIGPERDALRELSREEAYVSPEAYRYFQDVTDHLARVEDRVDTYRDLGASVMDMYLSAVSNELNLVMKRLTVVATVFMPGTLVASIFGMNLGFPFRDTYFGMLIALALIAAVSVGMYFDFVRRRWW